MKILKKISNQSSTIQLQRSSVGPAHMFRSVLLQNSFLDAKIASRLEPQKILRGHRVLLSACSKSLFKKFLESPDMNSLILIDLVDHKNLSYFVKLIYEGNVDMPESDLPIFKASMRSLNVRLDPAFNKIIDDEEDEDIPMSSDYDADHSLASSSEGPSVKVEGENEQPVLMSGEDFINRVMENSKEEIIQHFPDSSSSTAKSALPPVVTASKSVLKQGESGLYWIERSNPKKLPQNWLMNRARNNVAQVILSHDSKMVYYGFPTEKDAKNFLDITKLTDPNGPAPIPAIEVPNILILKKEEVIESVVVRITGLPNKWNHQMVMRMLRKNRFQNIPPGALRLNEADFSASIGVPNEVEASRLKHVLDGVVLDGSRISVTF